MTDDSSLVFEYSNTKYNTEIIKSGKTMFESTRVGLYNSNDNDNTLIHISRLAMTINSLLTYVYPHTHTHTQTQTRTRYDNFSNNLIIII